MRARSETFCTGSVLAAPFCLALVACTYSVADPATVGPATCSETATGALQLDSKMVGTAFYLTLARGSAGSTFVSGQRAPNTTLALDLNHPQPALQTPALFVASFDENEKVQWLSNIAVSLEAAVVSAAATRDGGVVVTGEFHGTLTAGGLSVESVPTTDNPPADFDTFLAKFDAHGSLVWIRSFGNDAYQGGRSVAVDANNDVLLATFSDGGTVSFESCADTDPGGMGLYLTKLDSDGHCLWSRKFPTTTHSDSTAIAYSDQDDTLLVGGQAIVGDLLGGNDGSGQVAFVARMSNGKTGPEILGAPTVFRSTDGGGMRRVTSIAVDPCKGDIAVAGAFYGNIQLGDTVYDYPFDGAYNKYGMFIAKLTPTTDAPAGGVRWAKAIVDDGAQNARRIAQNGRGDIVVVGDLIPGALSTGVDFGTGLLGGSTDPKDTDMFIAKYADTGDSASCVFAARPHDASGNEQQADDALLDETGSVLLAGSFFSAVNLTGRTGDEITNGTTNWSMVLAKFSP